VSSAIPELRIDRATIVPAAAPRLEAEGECRHRPIAPTTNVGREIASRGWHVVSEAQLGDHIAVAYVRGLLLGTSSMCFAVDGHVAMAVRNRLVAIVSAARSDPSNGNPGGGVHGDVIGYAYKVPGSGNFRITDGTGTAPPSAEIRIGPDGIAVGRLAPADSFCGGRVSVPNIYGRPMVSASRILLRSGWRPVNARLGLEECSGTGVGFCEFRYRRGRHSLAITTADEDHHIVGYEPRC
jgi:hypothetical protein